jgi:hypothetical protein
LSQKLQKLDASSEAGPWTSQTLTLIEQHPHVAASRLAKMVQRETKPFKANVVKLKRLGLTQSFEIGYEISPRGRVFLEKSRANNFVQKSELRVPPSGGKKQVKAKA